MTMAERIPGAELEIRDVEKHYHGRAVVRGVSLDVRSGEFLTLLGPSGSGKTTTLNMIAGFADVTSGSIRMDGVDLVGRPPHRRNIGMVFQQYALFPNMTVAQNVAFPLKQRKVAREEIRRRVAEALELVKLGDAGERTPRELSGGMQQRVALARAIVFRPQLLLMDEPLGALDRKLREWLQLEIRRIHQEVGITFVYVTHDQEEALVLSDRIAVFNDGLIEQVGDAADIYDRPRSLFVAEFVGESTVLKGRLERNGRGAVLTSGDVRVHVPPGGEGNGDGALVIRPECIRVLDAGEVPKPDHNVVSGVVTRAVYLGLARKLEVRTADGQVFSTRGPARGGALVEEGQRVTLAWRVEDAVLLRDAADSSTSIQPTDPNGAST